MGTPHIPISRSDLAGYCRRNQIYSLAFFGSVLRDDFGPDSDIDVLIEFKPDAEIGFMALSRMQRELSQLLGRPVDLVLRDGLKPLIRDSVISSAEKIYET